MGNRLTAGHAKQFGDLAWVGTNAGTLEQMPGISYIDDLLQMGLGHLSRLGTLMVDLPHCRKDRRAQLALR